jgi:hypothetical protein
MNERVLDDDLLACMEVSIHRPGDDDWQRWNRQVGGYRQHIGQTDERWWGQLVAAGYVYLQPDRWNDSGLTAKQRDLVEALQAEYLTGNVQFWRPKDQ